MTMTAIVLQTDRQSMLVRNEETGEEILVLFANAGQFAPGERILIQFSGQATASIPPQISAISIQRLGQTPPNASEMRAVVLQRGNGALLVRNLGTNQQFRVEFPYARHFCPRQRIIIFYDTITLSTPPTINATEITPMC